MALAHLRDLRHLRYLNLSECRQVTTRGLLYLRCPNRIELLDASFTGILSQISTYVRFDTTLAVDDSLLEHLAHNWPTLRCIELGSCPYISVRGCENFARIWCPNM